MSFRARGSNNRGYFKGKFVRFRIQKRSPKSKPQSPDANQDSGGTESGGSSQCPPCIDSNGHGHLNSVQTPSVSRAASTLPKQLETTDSGSVYFGNGGGNSDSFYHFSTSESSPSSDISQPVRKGCHRSRDFGDAPERGNSGGLSYERGISKLSFPCQEERWGNRPVINLKELNSYVSYQHFKMEGLYLLKHLVQTGDWMMKIDLKDAYFTVQVSTQHQPLLRFVHGGLRYQFSCLPFGLGPAPRLFTKLLRPVVALLRRLGLRLIIYLDDIIVFNQTQEGIVRDRDSTLWLLQHLGFVINWKKSVLHPAQSMEYLGFVISSIEMKRFLPPGKMSQLVQDCKDLILEKSASVRTLSQIIGKLTSTMQAVLPAPLHYRHLQMLQVKGLLEGKEYNSVVPLNMECRNDLQWWVDQLSIWNGRSLISPAPDLIITTDASLKGWDRGGILTAYKCPRTQGSSFCLRAFSKSRRKLHVHLRMDNRTAVAYLLKMGGTRSLVLVGIVQELWEYALRKEIFLTAKYLREIACENSGSFQDVVLQEGWHGP